MERDPLLDRLVPRLAQVRGVDAIVLGGSRAKGTATEASDYDIGLYYGADAALDTDHLLTIARDLVDDPARAAVTPVGEWGPRIVGGGWLSVGGRKVDLLYRGIEDVRKVIADCRTGQITMAYQPGHPHGFCSAIWMGEVAICKPLHDPSRSIAELKAMTSPYPDNLRAAVLRTFQWEISFSVENAQLAIPRGDKTHIAGCIYRALCCIAQVLFALNRRYLINEKGALAEAATFASTVEDLTERLDAIWRAVGGAEFTRALAALRALENELRALIPGSIVQ